MPLTCSFVVSGDMFTERGGLLRSKPASMLFVLASMFMVVLLARPELAAAGSRI